MRIQKKALTSSISTTGNILYRFNMDGKIYIGQSSRGFGRLYQHFGQSYYYSQSSGTFKNIEELKAKNSMYADLRQSSGKKLDLTYMTENYGLDQQYTAFLKFFRPIAASGQLYKYTNVDNSSIYKMDIAELLYIFYEQPYYNYQCGSQHNIAEIAFNKGMPIIGNRILIANTKGGTTTFEAKEILEKPISNSKKIQYDLQHHMQLDLSSFSEQTKELFISFIKEGCKQKQNITTFIKKYKETIKTIIDVQIKEFKTNLINSKIFETCSKPIKDGTIDYNIIGNESKIKNLFNLKEFLYAVFITGNKKIEDLDGNLGTVKIEYTLDKDTYDKIDAMDANLLRLGQTKVSFNGEEVDQDFRKKVATLRFMDIGEHVKNRVGSQMTGSDKIFHTRPTRMKYSEEEGGHELPEYAFVFNSNPDIRKSIVRDEFESSHTYIPEDGDRYYHVLMSIAEPADDLQFIRKLPLERRQRGVTRKQYAIYIYPQLPSGVSSSLPISDTQVYGAYAISGDDLGIREGIKDTIDLSNLTDY